MVFGGDPFRTPPSELDPNTLDPDTAELHRTLSEGAFGEKAAVAEILKDYGSNEWLESMLYDEGSIRLVALSYLGELGRIDSVPHILELLKKTTEAPELNDKQIVGVSYKFEEMYLQRSAIMALEKILDEDFLDEKELYGNGSASKAKFLSTGGFKDLIKTWEEQVLLALKEEKRSVPLGVELEKGKQLAGADRVKDLGNLVIDQITSEAPGEQSAEDAVIVREYDWIVGVFLASVAILVLIFRGRFGGSS